VPCCCIALQGLNPPAYGGLFNFLGGQQLATIQFAPGQQQSFPRTHQPGQGGLAAAAAGARGRGRGGPPALMGHRGPAAGRGGKHGGGQHWSSSAAAAGAGGGAAGAPSLLQGGNSGMAASSSDGSEYCGREYNGVKVISKATVVSHAMMHAVFSFVSWLYLFWGGGDSGRCRIAMNRWEALRREQETLSLFCPAILGVTQV